MSNFRSINEMSVSPSLLDRIAACLATRRVPNPRQTAYDNAYLFAASEGWAEAWTEATTTYNVNLNPDMGARNDVISDDMILAAVEQFFQPVERTDETTGETTTKAVDPTLPPEAGGPEFVVEPPTPNKGRPTR